MVRLFAVRSGCPIWIFSCFQCHWGRSFQVNEFSDRALPDGDVAMISCPHCGATNEGGSGAIFSTHAPSVEDTAAFIKAAVDRQ